MQNILVYQCRLYLSAVFSAAIASINAWTMNNKIGDKKVRSELTVLAKGYDRS